MPTYQYACTDCGHRFEAVQSFHDDALTHCPECDGRLRKVFNAVGVVFKGSGFYRTDSRNGQGASTSGKDASTGSSDAGGSGGGAKSDSGSSASSGSTTSTSGSSSGSSAASSSSSSSSSSGG